MRENINNAHDLFRSLNKTLKPISYGGDRYQFRNIPSVSKQKLYEMIMSKFNIEGFNLFSQQRKSGAPTRRFFKIKFKPDTKAQRNTG